MNSENDKNYILEFLADYSARTWIELKKVHQGHFRINETTITQNLIKDFVINSEYLGLPLYLFESRNEKANGNDLEIFVETANGFILIPTQAKIVKGSKYPTISHITGVKPQIELLIKYANTLGGIPAYLFYNYFDDYAFQEYVDRVLPEYYDLHFGCTIGRAVAIYENFYYKSGQKKWDIPTFEDLHLPMNYAFPMLYTFFRLINGGIQDVRWFARNRVDILQNIRFYQFKELVTSESWKPFWKPGRISGISGTPPLMGDPFETVMDYIPEVLSHFAANERFAPMYRIIICIKSKYKINHVS